MPRDGAGHRRPRPRRLTLRRAFTRSRQQVNARARSASPATRPHARHGAAAARARRPEHTAHRYTRSALVRNRAGFVYPGLVVEPATMAAATTASMTLTTRCAARGFAPRSRRRAGRARHRHPRARRVRRCPCHGERARAFWSRSDAWPHFGRALTASALKPHTLTGNPTRNCLCPETVPHYVPH